jgi:hypothetical protein
MTKRILDDKKQKERSPELGRLLKRRLKPRRGSCKHGVDLLRPFSSHQLDYNASPGKSSSSWFMQSVRVL